MTSQAKTATVGLMLYPSAGMFMLVDVPIGFSARAVVPYDPERRVLIANARVFHERNGYSGLLNSPHGKLKEEDVFMAGANRS